MISVSVFQLRHFSFHLFIFSNPTPSSQRITSTLFSRLLISLINFRNSSIPWFSIFRTHSNNKHANFPFSFSSRCVLQFVKISILKNTERVWRFCLALVTYFYLKGIKILFIIFQVYKISFFHRPYLLVYCFEEAFYKWVSVLSRRIWNMNFIVFLSKMLFENFYNLLYL